MHAVASQAVRSDLHIESCCSISAIADGARRTRVRPRWISRATTLRTSSRTSSDCASICGIERWLVLGGSWGSTLALAYAERFPNRVTEIILFGVTTGRRKEFDWSFRGGLADLFPEQWERLRDAVPAALRDGDIIEAYCRLLHDPDPAIRDQAALAWCTWESATPAWPPAHGLSPRFRDPAFRMAFARIVTHYVRHYAWLEDGSTASRRARDRRHSRHHGERTLRSAGADRMGLRPQARVAACEACDRRRRRPRRIEREHRRRTGPRNR